MGKASSQVVGKPVKNKPCQNQYVYLITNYTKNIAIF